ncbi:hypothetical protein BGZ63DRAFT_95658 [Mariannaea sp. PMI_226]|nr:hypothetical protein BGZ63DRAFT_95658 [Mariannaea sp. PMI_226]
MQGPKRSERHGNVLCSVHDDDDTINDNTSKPSPPSRADRVPRSEIQLAPSTQSFMSSSPRRSRTHQRPSPPITATTTTNSRMRPKRARSEQRATRH